MNRHFIKLIVMSIIASIALAIAGLYANIQVKSSIESEQIASYAQQEELISEEVAMVLKLEITNTINALRAIALNKDVQSGTPEACNAALETYMKNLDLKINNLGRVDSNKNFRCSLNEALIGSSATRLGDYLSPMFDQADHQPIVSRMLKVPNVEGMVIAIHVPVFDMNSEFTGSVGGAIYLEQLAQQDLKNVKFAKSGYAELHDDNGDILYTEADGLLYENVFSDSVQERLEYNNNYNRAIEASYDGKQAIFRYKLGGEYHQAAITPVEIIPGHRWSVLVTVPEKEIITTFIASSLDRAFTTILTIYILSVTLVIAILIYTSSRNYRFNQDKDDFLSMASHQLRTPLTAIAWNSELMIDGEVGPISDAQKLQLQEINSSSKNMSQLVGALLDTSRLDMNKFEQDNQLHDINELVDSVVKEVDSEIKRKHIKFTKNIKVNGQLIFDEKWYRMVILNLLSNAAKYTKENGHIEFEVNKLAKGSNVANRKLKSGSLYIRVADNGYGIPADQQDQIFHKMFRADNVENQETGTGLGLYILREIITKSEGEVWFNSEDGKGTTFHVILPLIKSPTKRKE